MVDVQHGDGGHVTINVSQERNNYSTLMKESHSMPKPTTETVRSGWHEQSGANCDHLHVEITEIPAVDEPEWTRCWESATGD